MTLKTFSDSPWLEYLQSRRDHMQEGLNYLDGSLSEEQLRSIWGAHRHALEQYIELADALLAGVDDSDWEKKIIYQLSKFELMAIIYSQLPFVRSNHAQKQPDLLKVIRMLERGWIADLRRMDSARTGRTQQVERTKEANKDFYKKLCDIATEFLDDEVTVRRVSRKTKDYFDEKKLWIAFKSKPLSVKTVRKILREYKIISR